MLLALEPRVASPSARAQILSSYRRDWKSWERLSAEKRFSRAAKMRLQFSKRAHDLLGDLDLGSAIVLCWPLWRIEIVGIDRAMLEIEVNSVLW